MRLQEIEEGLYAYGQHDSFEGLIGCIAKRKEEGETDLRGAAICYILRPDGLSDRMSVRIMSDGSLNFAHAEWF